ncbi:MAG: Trm112 family protein [Planctomycetota bacterium]|jgi:uncharacterized protein YbaR (Trm112 family)
MAGIIDIKLLNILVCPVSKKRLVQKGDWLVCEEVNPHRRYPVKDGIPVLLAEESEILDSGGNWVKSE